MKKGDVEWSKMPELVSLITGKYKEGQRMTDIASFLEQTRGLRVTKGMVAGVLNRSGAIRKGRKVGIMQLTPRTCRWPIGDPKTEDFQFCGKLKEGKGPYCARHTDEGTQVR